MFIVNTVDTRLDHDHSHVTRTNQVPTTAKHVGPKLDTNILACIHSQNLKHIDRGMGRLHMHAHTLQRIRSVTYICKHFCISTCSHNKVPLMYTEAHTCIHACMHECMHVHDIQVTQIRTYTQDTLFCLEPKKLQERPNKNRPQDVNHLNARAPCVF